MDWITPLLALLAALAGIVAKALSNKNADHATIVADVDQAFAEFHQKLADLDAAAKAAAKKTDDAIAAAEQRLAEPTASEPEPAVE